MNLDSLQHTKPFIISLLLMVLICGFIASVQAKSGTKWTDYTDPYGRYTIKHPSKWTIQSEPVHSAASQLLEVPLKVSNSHASTLMVNEIKNDVGLSAREFASFVQNHDFTSVPKKLISPVSCGVVSQLSVEVCEYYEIYTYGFNEMGHKAILFSDSSNRVFQVDFLFGPDEPLSADNINYMLGSFRVLGQSTSGDVTTPGQENTYSDWSGENTFDKDVIPCGSKVQTECHTYQLK